MVKIIENWILCPICRSKTRLRIREDTELKKFPLYYPKCKRETLINAHKLHIYVIKTEDDKIYSNEIYNVLRGE